MINYRLMPLQEVKDLVGLSRSAIYRNMREGRFPTPIKIGGGAVRWRSDEMEQYVESRPRATGEGAQAPA